MFIDGGVSTVIYGSIMKFFQTATAINSHWWPLITPTDILMFANSRTMKWIIVSLVSETKIEAETETEGDTKEKFLLQFIVNINSNYELF